MLTKAFLVLSGLFLVGAAQSDFYSDLSLFHELQQEPYKINWDWRNPVASSRRAIADDLFSDEETDEREPLAKDYKDPPAASSEQKPVLVPKPKIHLKSIPEKSEKHDQSEKPEKPENPQKPDTPLHGLIPDGVIDVNADGFGGAFNPFNPEFDFSSSFGVNSKPFGLGDIFTSIQSNQWWKGKSKPKETIDVEIISSPDDFDFDSVVTDYRRRLKERIHEQVMSSPIDLDFYSVSKRRRKQNPKKIIFDLDEFQFSN